MGHNKRVNDQYTNKARKEGYLARSAYKLQELDEKYTLLDHHVQTVLDIGCAPGSWLQYLSQNIQSTGSHEPTILGLDITPVDQQFPYVTTYQQDVSERGTVAQIFENEEIEQFDLIVSDMAPDTMGQTDIDALRSIVLIEKTLWIYQHYLKEGGKFVIKVFMGPEFQKLLEHLKEEYGSKQIVTYKPKASRKSSKETYIVKRA